MERLTESYSESCLAMMLYKCGKKGNDEIPNWQTISTLPMFAFIIYGMLHEDQERHKNLLEVERMSVSVIRKATRAGSES